MGVFPHSKRQSYTLRVFSAAKHDGLMLDGTWKPLGGKLGDQSIPLPGGLFTIVGGSYRVETPEGPASGTLKLDDRGSVAKLDLLGQGGSHDGQLIEAIVRVRGDLLQMNYDAGGGRRPVNFTSVAGSSVVAVRYRRVES